MDISAVVLSARPVTTTLPEIRVVGHVSAFSDAAGLLDARLAALEKVRTEWFFFLDDDDELPADHLRVLERCVSAGAPLAYTDELIRMPAYFDGHVPEFRRKSGPYSQDAHLRDALLVHHLAVCRTDAALRAARIIPRGTYAVEPLLYWQVAKEGAAYVDEVGYIWTRGRTGLSRHPTLTRGLARAMLWAQEHRT